MGARALKQTLPASWAEHLFTHFSHSVTLRHHERIAFACNRCLQRANDIRDSREKVVCQLVCWLQSYVDATLAQKKKKKYGPA